MKKNYIIITEELKKEPGIYGIKELNDQKEVIELNFATDLEEIIDLEKWKNIKNSKNELSKAFFNVADKGFEISKNFFKNTFSQRMYSLEKIASFSESLKKSNLKNEIAKHSVIIPSHSFENGYHLFEESIFDGCFKNEKDIEKILPKNSDFTLFIIEKSNASKIFYNGKNIELGLNVINLDEGTVFPIKNYQEKKWKNIELALRTTFSNLGLKRLYIKEVDSINMNSNLPLKLTSLNLNSTTRFEIEYEEIWEEQEYDSEKALGSLKMLEDIPLFHSIALDLISKPRKGKIKRIETMDFSLGMDLNILAKFNPNLNVVKEKKIEIEIEL